MKKLLGLLFCALVVFTSCDGSINITTYVQDLLELKTSKEPLYTTATIVSQGITKPEEVDYLKRLFPSMTNEHTVKVGYSDAYSFDIKVPIIAEDTEITPDMQDVLLALVVRKSDSGYIVSCHYNQAKINEIKDWVYNTYYQKFDLKEYKLSISVVNDSRNDFNFKSNSVYVEDMAYPFDFTTTLSKRESVLLNVSEVMNSAMITNSETIYPLIEYK